MKKRKTLQKIEPPTQQNLVAKYARQFVKAHVFADKTKYTRKGKRKNQEDFPSALSKVFGKSACF